MKDQLRDRQTTLTDEDEREVVSRYVQQLVSSLRQLVGFWQIYIDEMNEGNFDTAYRAPLLRLPRRGRPSLVPSWVRD